jgi:hypothetical protein
LLRPVLVVVKMADCAALIRPTLLDDDQKVLEALLLVLYRFARSQ